MAVMTFDVDMNETNAGMFSKVIESIVSTYGGTIRFYEEPVHLPVFSDFVRDCLCVGPDVGLGRVSLADLHGLYVAWWRNNIDTARLPSLSELRNAVQASGLEMRSWLGKTYVDGVFVRKEIRDSLKH